VFPGQNEFREQPAKEKPRAPCLAGGSGPFSFPCGPRITQQNWVGGGALSKRRSGSTSEAFRKTVVHRDTILGAARPAGVKWRLASSRRSTSCSCTAPVPSLRARSPSCSASPGRPSTEPFTVVSRPGGRLPATTKQARLRQQPRWNQSRFEAPRLSRQHSVDSPGGESCFECR